VIKPAWKPRPFITAALTACLFGPSGHVGLEGGLLDTHPIAPAAASPPPPPRKPVLTPDELRRFRPNEAGDVPILEYHEIGGSEGYMSRSRENFQDDLDRLYAEGYRPISLADYLSNRIDLPAGLSPVVLTFDDARGSQFRYHRDGSIDPDCAVGILLAFHETHPDFALKATFFLLPQCPFDDSRTGAKKVRALAKMGFEIGNHTLHHRWLNRLSDAGVVKEIAGGAALLHKMVPQATVDTLAFPGGFRPRNSRLIAAGQYRGFHYLNRGGFLAFGEPAVSPVAKNQDRLHIRRIVATEGDCGLDYWLRRLRSGKTPRYVSDGDPLTITVPRKYAARVDSAFLNGAVLVVY